MNYEVQSRSDFFFRRLLLLDGSNKLRWDSLGRLLVVGSKSPKNIMHYIQSCIDRAKCTQWWIVTAVKPPWSSRPASAMTPISHACSASSTHGENPLFLVEDITFCKVINVKIEEKLAFFGNVCRI
jgi:hypothetical protein